MSQRSLGDFGVDVDEPEEETEKREVTGGGNLSRAQIALKRAPEGAEPYDDLSCPWCLGSKDDFNIRTEDDPHTYVPEGQDKVVSCGHCHASIPINADWYLRGEKVCLE